MYHFLLLKSDVGDQAGQADSHDSEHVDGSARRQKRSRGQPLNIIEDLQYTGCATVLLQVRWYEHVMVRKRGRSFSFSVDLPLAYHSQAYCSSNVGRCDES